MNKSIPVTENLDIKRSNYIFPSPMAKIMSVVSPKVQYESSMLGTALLCLSVVITSVYYIFFTQSNWFVKGFVIFNGLAGLLLLGSMLVTTYQQYLQYMQAVELQKMLNGVDISVIPASPTKIRRIRYGSAAIETIILVGTSWLTSFWWLMILELHALYLTMKTESFIKKEMEKEVKVNG